MTAPTAPKSKPADAAAATVDQPPEPAPDQVPAAPTVGDVAGMAVVYTGTADIKELDATAWKGVGVEDQHKTVWDPSNGHSLPASDLSPDAVAYLVTQDDFDFQPAE